MNAPSPHLTVSVSDAVKFSWAGESVTGKVRLVNEDYFACRAGLFLVADGMGGHQAGDVASKIAVDQLVAELGPPPVEFGYLEQVVGIANSSVRSRAAESGLLGMGTTLVGLVWVVHDGAQYLVVVNVGDSRCYVADEEGFRKLTHDHSVVQDMVDSGAISAEEARTHADRNVVTRAVGVDAELFADYLALPAAGSQRLLLCSDGVSTQISDDDLQQVLVDAPTPERAVRCLIDLVLVGRAPDNATAVVVDAEWSVRADDADDTQVTSPRGAVPLDTALIASVPSAPTLLVKPTEENPSLSSGSSTEAESASTTGDAAVDDGVADEPMGGGGVR